MSVVVAVFVLRFHYVSSSYYTNVGALALTRSLFSNHTFNPNYLKRAKVLNEQNDRAGYLLGRAYYEDTQYQKALKEFSTSGIASHSPLVVMYIGLTQASLGQRKAAIGTWRNVPRIAFYHLRRGETALEKGQLDVAEEAFRYALQVDLKDHVTRSRAYVGWARTLEEAGNISRSIEFAELAIQTSPSNIDAYDTLVHILFTHSNDRSRAALWEGEAARVLREAGNHKTHLYAARALLWRESFAAAEAELLIYLRDVPSSEYGYGLLCGVQMRLGQFQDAVHACGKRIELLDAAKAPHYTNLGEALYAAGLFQEAENAFRDALALDSSYTRAIERLALLSDLQQQ